MDADSPKVVWTGTQKSTGYPPPDPPAQPTGWTNAIVHSTWDHYYLTVDSTRSFEVAISWEHAADDFDLYVYRGRVPKSENAPLDSSAGSSTRVSGTHERVSIADTEAGEYTIRVIYRRVTQSVYRGAAVLVSDFPAIGRAERGAYPLIPNDQFFQDQWGISKIQAPDAWQERNATGHGITIGIVDSGVELTHPDLTCPGKLLVLEGATIGSNLPPEDTDGHGTHVAGIAAACTNNETGVVGVAPDATIMPVNVIDAMLDSDLLPGGTDAAMAAGIRFACGAPADPSDPCGADGNGAHVINLSIGPPPQEGSHFPNFYPKTEEALEEAREAGVVIVAASGNTSSPICQYPSLSRFVICVGATDGNDRKTGYSDFPNNVDSAGRFHASVVAPGGDLVPSGGDVCSARILSTYLQSATASCSPATGYAGLAGTSMASPHVAGVAALVYDRLGGERILENGDKVVQAIIDTADDDLYAPGYDAFSGYGLVDARAAVNSIELPEEEEKVTDPTPDPDPQPEPSPEPSPSSSDPGSPTAYQVTVSPHDVKDRVGTESMLTASVVDADGQPLSGISVEWASVGVGELVDVEESTDADGRAHANVVSEEPGDQRIMVWTESCTADGRCWGEVIRHHGPERCDVFGTRGDDLLRGTDAAEVFCGFGGNDVIVGGDGNDVLLGRSGSDELYGGAGRDRLLGGAGPDVLHGEAGADRLVGGAGNDYLSGGRGRDTCRASSGDRVKSCRT